MTSSWLEGPVARPREERLVFARAIAERARERFDAVAVGFYGSIARNADGPYSDIEIHCITSAAPDEDIEWIHDGWAIDVNVRSRASALRHATEVPGNWAISHANYLYVSPVHDPQDFFGELQAAMKTVPEERFTRAIADVLGHLYGATSKLRNARHWGVPPVPGFLLYVAALGCNMIGLANRHAYSTATAALAESLGLPDRLRVTTRCAAGLSRTTWPTTRRCSLCATATGKGPPRGRRSAASSSKPERTFCSARRRAPAVATSR